MAGQPGFFDLGRALSGAVGGRRSAGAAGDGGRLRAVPAPSSRRRWSARIAAKGGRPPYDAVLMFKVLVLQTLYTLSDDQTEYQLRDRLSFMRFVGLALHDPVPDAKTIWLFREQLTRAGAIERLFARFDAPARRGLSRDGRPDRRCHHRRGAAGRG